MPAYEYECHEHGRTTLFLRMSQCNDVVFCSVCGNFLNRIFTVPHLKTATTYSAKMVHDGGQFENPVLRERYTREMRAKGISTSGKFYVAGIADRPGDPSAWVSDIDEAKRKMFAERMICEELGIRHERPEPERVALAPDLVEKYAETYLHDVPVKERTRNMVMESRERAVHEHGARNEAFVPGRDTDRGLLDRMDQISKEIASAPVTPVVD